MKAGEKAHIQIHSNTPKNFQLKREELVLLTDCVKLFEEKQKTLALQAQQETGPLTVQVTLSVLAYQALKLTTMILGTPYNNTIAIWYL